MHISRHYKLSTSLYSREVIVCLLRLSKSRVNFWQSFQLFRFLLIYWHSSDISIFALWSEGSFVWGSWNGVLENNSKLVLMILKNGVLLNFLFSVVENSVRASLNFCVLVLSATSLISTTCGACLQFATDLRWCSFDKTSRRSSGKTFSCEKSITTLIGNIDGQEFSKKFALSSNFRIVSYLF